MNEIEKTTRRTTWLAVATIAAQALFIAGWVVAGLLEGHGYSSAEHDISDLAALTAHHAWISQLTLGIQGGVTIAFAFLVMRPLFGAAAGWLVALSLAALDPVSDVFIRLSWRAADAGCSTSDAIASWHGQIHVASFVVSALATVAAPWVLAGRMQQLDEWATWVRPTRVFGVLTIIVLALTGAAAGTAVQGAAQRVAAVFVCAGLAVLASRVVQLSVGVRGSFRQLAGR